MDDQTLRRRLADLRQGEPGAFEAIYDALQVPVYTVALRTLYDAPLAEDVTQELFLRLYRDPPGPEVARPRAWLFKMTRNLAIDTLRRRRPESELSDETAAVRSMAAAVGAKLDVEAALAALPPDDRMLVTLHLNGGLRFRELAEVTGRPLGTVLWRYQRALSLLRAHLNGGNT